MNEACLNTVIGKLETATVLITAQSCEFDKQLARVFAEKGHQVYAMQTGDDPQAIFAQIKADAGKLDFLLDTTDFAHSGDVFSLRLPVVEDTVACSHLQKLQAGGIADGINANIIETVYRKNVLVSMRLLEIFLPLLDLGVGKRLLYVSCANASIGGTRLTSQYAYAMSKAALHQFIQLTRNKLAQDGYTFRIFDPIKDGFDPTAAAKSAYQYIIRRRGTERHDPRRDDEEHVVMRDALGRQHGW